MDAALDKMLKALERMDAMTIALCEARGIPTVPTSHYIRRPARPLTQRNATELVAEHIAGPAPAKEAEPADAAMATEEPKPVAETPAPEPAPVPVEQKLEAGPKPGSAAAYSDSETPESDDDLTVDGKGGTNASKDKPSMETARKNRSPASEADNKGDASPPSDPQQGEVSDAGSGSSAPTGGSGSEGCIADDPKGEFDDGYDGNLMGDDQARLADMTEKEGEQNRKEAEREKKLRLAKRNGQKREAKMEQCGSARTKSGEGVSPNSRRKERRRIVEERKGELNKEQAIKDPKAERKRQRRERKRIRREPTEFGDRRTRTPVGRGAPIRSARTAMRPAVCAPDRPAVAWRPAVKLKRNGFASNPSSHYRDGWNPFHQTPSFRNKERRGHRFRYQQFPRSQSDPSPFYAWHRAHRSCGVPDRQPQRRCHWNDSSITQNKNIYY